MTRSCQCENQALVSIETQCDLCQGQIFPEFHQELNYPEINHLVDEWLAYEAFKTAYAA